MDLDHDLDLDHNPDHKFDLYPIFNLESKFDLDP